MANQCKLRQNVGLESMNMMSNYDVTNNAHQIQWHHTPLNETPPLKIFCVCHWWHINYGECVQKNIHNVSTNFAKTLVWKPECDIKLWRHKHRTPNINDHHMPLNETPPMKIFCVSHWCRLWCRHLKAFWLRPAFGESCRLLGVNYAKGPVVDHVWDAPDQDLQVMLQMRDMCKASIILQ